MNKQQLISNIRAKKSFLCVGLDTDLKKIPAHLLQTEDPIFAFNKAIIDATAPYCVAYKPNLAFYECFGLKGWIAFEKPFVILRRTILTSSSLLTQNAVILAILLQCMHVHFRRNGH